MRCSLPNRDAITNHESPLDCAQRSASKNRELYLPLKTTAFGVVLVLQTTGKSLIKLSAS